MKICNDKLEVIQLQFKMFHKDLTKKEIIEILKSSDSELFVCADKIRQEYKGNIVHLRGLIEFSNICKCNCFYCGLRCENKNIQRYRLTNEEILSSVKMATGFNFKTIVLQGGEDSFYTTSKICNLIEEIKSKYDVALTLSIGERSKQDYQAFKDAGADRYLLKIETTDEALYNSLHPNMSLKNRMECLFNLKEIGFETGSGCLVGLPNQTIESLADDLLFFKKLDADMIGIGAFIPHPDTPLAMYKQNNFDLALRVMALTRIMLPDINIPATTAMETLKKNGRTIALNSGANVVMPNVTSNLYKQKYEIYPDKAGSKDLTEENIKSIIDKIQALGRTISTSKGFRDK